MSTSPSRAPVRRSAGDDSAPESELQPFPYDPIPQAMARTVALGQIASLNPALQAQAEAADRESQARAQGQKEGQAKAQMIYQEQLAKERSNLAATLAQFARDRAAYFERVEAEVVQLAVSIARKILHREAQIDPLLLVGLVRVALEKIDGATHIVLRVHPQNSADWHRYLATHLQSAELPEIIEDPLLPQDRCTLETSMGAATIGLDVQLKEIEQGLMDLLASRPGAAS